MKRKRYPRKFQRMAVERMRNCEDVGELAKELLFTYLVHPGKVLYVGYNDILDNRDPRLLLLNRPARPPGTRFLETRHEFFVKFSYLFRF